MGFFSSTSEAVSRPAGSTAPAASGNSRRNREVSGTLGSGGPLIRARAVNGGIQIRQF